MVIFYSFFFLFFFAIFLEVYRLKDGELKDGGKWMVHGSGMMIARIIFMRMIESNLLLLKDTWYRNHIQK